MRRSTKKVALTVAALLFLAPLVFTSSSGAAEAYATQCSAYGKQWQAQTNPAIVKAYVQSPSFLGSDDCDNQTVTQYVDLFGTLYTFSKSGTSQYVYAPNTSGAYGTPGAMMNAKCLAGPANPCSLAISVLDDGAIQQRSAI